MTAPFQGALSPIAVTVSNCVPRSTNWYSSLALQCASSRYSAPPPAVHPDLVCAPAPVKQWISLAQKKLKLPAWPIATRPGKTRFPLTEVLPSASPPVPKSSRLGVASQPNRPRTVPYHSVFCSDVVTWRLDVGANSVDMPLALPAVTHRLR